jgi:hypothetical protein
LGEGKADIKKPAFAGLFLHPELLLFIAVRVGWGGFNFARLYDVSRKRLMGDKSASTVDILALVVALFCFDTQISTGSRVGSVLT